MKGSEDLHFPSTSTSRQAAFWRLETQPDRAVALYDASSGKEISYAELRGKRDEVQMMMDRGRGLCLIKVAPTVACIATYLAALNANCPVILQEAKTDGTDADDPFPCLYRFDAGEDRFSFDLRGVGLALHPDLRLLLSTSGSTGARKFVRLSSENLASNAAAIAQYLRLRPGDRAPTALPLAYSYGMSVLNSHLHVGASVLLIDEPVISEAFWQAFDAHGCTSFAGVPQSFTLLARGGQLDRPHPRLRYLTQAGGKLGPEAVRDWAMKGRRQGWDFYVMYGQTEASPRIAYLPPEMALEHPSAIGRAIPGGRLWIGGPDSAELPPGHEGELIYEGPNVMMGYATETADLRMGQGPRQLRTGDLGYSDAAGIVTITGRASRFLKLAGKRVSLDQVESRLARDGIDAIATGHDDLLGLVHTGTGNLVTEVAKWLSVPASFVRDIPVEVLPLNQNGKPDLKAAKAIFDARIVTTTAPRPERAGALDLAVIAALFRRQFPGRTITSESSFDDLGGTSNDFIELELALEDAGVAPFENWQNHSIADLAARAEPGQNVPRRVPDYASARVICSILVVLLHVTGLGPDSGLRLPVDSILHQINDVFDPLRMPMFALLSGYSFHVMRNARAKPRDLAGTIVVRLLAPTSAAIAVFAVLSSIVGSQFAITSPGNLARLFLLPYAHYWFIMALTWMMLVSYAVLRYLPGRSEILLIALAIGLTLFPVKVGLNVWDINGAAYLMPFFVLGYFYSANAEAVHDHWPAVACAALGMLALSSAVALEPGTMGWRVEKLALSLAAIALCLIIAGHVPLIARLAPYTFFIYLWHPIGTSGMRRVLEVLGLYSLGPNIVLGLVAGVGLPVALYHAIGYLPISRLLRSK